MYSTLMNTPHAHHDMLVLVLMGALQLNNVNMGLGCSIQFPRAVERIVCIAFWRGNRSSPPPSEEANQKTVNV